MSPLEQRVAEVLRVAWMKAPPHAEGVPWKAIAWLVPRVAAAIQAAAEATDDDVNLVSSAIMHDRLAGVLAALRGTVNEEEDG